LSHNIADRMTNVIQSFDVAFTIAQRGAAVSIVTPVRVGPILC